MTIIIDATYICEYCGKSFMTTEYKINQKKNGNIKHLYCSSECARDAQKPLWEDIVGAFKARDYILVSDTYVNAKTKLDYICSKHKNEGLQSITYNNLKAGFGCRYCGLERTADKRRLSIDDVKQIFDRNDMELCDGQDYTNTSNVMAYICKHHRDKGVQYMLVSNAYTQHCPYCKMSKGENAIKKFLDNHNIKYEVQKKYNDLLSKKGNKLSYDFYLPDYNLLIEYQGEFHHGKPSIQTNDEYSMQKLHDKLKNDYANNHKIKLLEIWYYDFKNIDKILDSYLLESSETAGIIR